MPIVFGGFVIETTSCLKYTRIFLSNLFLFYKTQKFAFQLKIVYDPYTNTNGTSWIFWSFNFITRKALVSPSLWSSGGLLANSNDRAPRSRIFYVDSTRRWANNFSAARCYCNCLMRFENLCVFRYYHSCETITITVNPISSKWRSHRIPLLPTRGRRDTAISLESYPLTCPRVWNYPLSSRVSFLPDLWFYSPHACPHLHRSTPPQ
jgi:hypothetical protein